MRFGSLLKRDLGWCPEGKSALKVERLSLKGPFRHVTACLEKTGNYRKNRMCLMFITNSAMIIMPVSYASLKAHQESAKEPKQAGPVMGQLFHRDGDSIILERLDNLVRRFRENTDEEFMAEHDTDAIPLDTIKEITITWIRSSGRYSRLLFPFSLYPVEPANARYRANYRLAIATGKKNVVVITPFLPGLKRALLDLLGEKVHEIPDEYAPIL
jgi:hypothetical protein